MHDGGYDATREQKVKDWGDSLAEHREASGSRLLCGALQKAGVENSLESTQGLELVTNDVATRECGYSVWMVEE